MFHLQQITDSGKEVEEEARQEYDYEIESQPVDWLDSNVEELYDFISEISKYLLFALYLYVVLNNILFAEEDFLMC